MPGPRSPEETAARRAQLVAVARRIVERDGAAALTMRTVAAEAGCSVGLPYKLFADRNELVAAVVADDFARLRDAFDAIVDAAGTRTVAANLNRWASLLLRAPSIGLAHDVHADPRLAAAIADAAGRTGIVEALDGTVRAYLAAEKRHGRVRADVDERALAFLIAGAVHNLLVSGDAYPRPSARRLERMLGAVADALG